MAKIDSATRSDAVERFLVILDKHGQDIEEHKRDLTGQIHTESGRKFSTFQINALLSQVTIQIRKKLLEPVGITDGQLHPNDFPSVHAQVRLLDMSETAQVETAAAALGISVDTLQIIAGITEEQVRIALGIPASLGPVIDSHHAGKDESDTSASETSNAAGNGEAIGAIETESHQHGVGSAVADDTQSGAQSTIPEVDTSAFAPMFRESDIEDQVGTGVAMLENISSSHEVDHAEMRYESLRQLVDKKGTTSMSVDDVSNHFGCRFDEMTPDEIGETVGYLLEAQVHLLRRAADEQDEHKKTGILLQVAETEHCIRSLRSLLSVEEVQSNIQLRILYMQTVAELFAKALHDVQQDVRETEDAIRTEGDSTKTRTTVEATIHKITSRLEIATIDALLGRKLVVEGVTEADIRDCTEYIDCVLETLQRLPVGERTVLLREVLLSASQLKDRIGIKIPTKDFASLEPQCRLELLHLQSRLQQIMLGMAAGKEGVHLVETVDSDKHTSAVPHTGAYVDYDTPDKELGSRESLRQYLEEHIPLPERATKKVLFLGGRKLLDVKYVFDPLGFSRQNLTAVEMDTGDAGDEFEENAKSLGINYVHDSLENFLIFSGERWDVIYLDFHSCLYKNIPFILGTVLLEQDSDCVVAVNLEGKREQETMQELLYIRDMNLRTSSEMNVMRHVVIRDQAEMQSHKKNTTLYDTRERQLAGVLLSSVGTRRPENWQFPEMLLGLKSRASRSEQRPVRLSNMNSKARDAHMRMIDIRNAIQTDFGLVAKQYFSHLCSQSSANPQEAVSLMDGWLAVMRLASGSVLFSDIVEKRYLSRVGKSPSPFHSVYAVARIPDREDLLRSKDTIKFFLECTQHLNANYDLDTINQWAEKLTRMNEEMDHMNEWKILQSAMKGKEVDMQRVAEIFMNMPYVDFAKMMTLLGEFSRMKSEMPHFSHLDQYGRKIVPPVLNAMQQMPEPQALSKLFESNVENDVTMDTVLRLTAASHAIIESEDSEMGGEAEPPLQAKQEGTRVLQEATPHPRFLAYFSSSGEKVAEIKLSLLGRQMNYLAVVAMKDDATTVRIDEMDLSADEKGVAKDGIDQMERDFLKRKYGFRVTTNRES